MREQLILALMTRPPRIRVVIAIVILIASLLIAGVLILLSLWLHNSDLLVIGQMILLAVVVCLIPTFVYSFVYQETFKHFFFDLQFFPSRGACAVIEIFLYLIVFWGFAQWLFGSVGLGIWLVYAFALLLLLEVGSFLVEWQKEITLERLSVNTLLNLDAEAIEKMARSEVVLYFSVPLGLFAGTLVGLLQHKHLLAIMINCLQLVLLFASLFLLYFLLQSFKRMCNPMFKRGQVSLPQVVRKEHKGILGALSSLTEFNRLQEEADDSRPFAKLFRSLRISIASKDEVVDEQKENLDIAVDVTHLRKVYKYDSLHNSILLVAFAAVVIQLWRIPINLSWVIISLLMMTFLFSEVPYAIGQNVLHQKILDKYIGVQYAELAKKLKEYAPIFPPLNSLAALATTGTAGGVLFTLLNQLIQDILKNITK